MQKDELRTPRLLLRAWREKDKDAFAAMNADPEVMRYFPGVMDRAASDALADRIDATHTDVGYTLWAVEVLESDRGATPFAGFTGLSIPSFDVPFDHADPCVEVGWRLSADWWGVGIASEAARASIAYGFDILGLREIVSFTSLTNEPSYKVMERIGMHRSGEFDHPRAEPTDWWRRQLLYRMEPGDPRL